MSVCYLVPYAAEDVAAMRLVTSMTLVTRQLKNAIAVSAVIVLAILVFTVMSGLYFVRSIVVPLGQVERTAASIARGELDVRLPVTGDQRDDPDRLRQVFINILDNAIKYSAPGGRITVKLWKGQYKAFIEIIDQGRGIPPEDLENVKTKFYKGSNSVRGSGIGLALVDSIMTALDGTLDIKSTLGRGTVVTLGLPLYQK